MSKVDRNIRAHKKHLKGNRPDVRAKKGEFDIEIDVFDKGLPINKMTDICQLCKGDHFDGELMHKNFSILGGGGGDEDEGDVDATKNVDMLDPEGIWASQYSIKSNHRRRSFVHFDCALYAPQISFNGIEWSNIRKEVLRGSTLTCYHCHKKGSTILCSQPRCNYIVHLPCAIKEGFLPSRFVNTGGYYCRIHSKENMDIETQLDKLVVSDVSLGRETIPVIMKNDVDDLPFPKGFEYITSNVDSDVVIATPQNVCSDDFQCCDCVGLCNDVNQCACLRVEFQRNYSSKGKLIPGADRPLLECNMRCNCSVNRCTNRVVERGLQYPLQLFRRSYGVNRSSIGDSNENSNATSAVPKKRLRQGPTDEKGWGVITMEEIPQGAFVCELIGQYADISTLSMDKKAWQAIESCSADGDEKMRLNTFLDNHVVPISLWGAGTSHGRTPVSSILGNSDSIVGPQHDVVLIDIPDSEIVSIGLNDDSDVLLDSATATSLAVRSSSTAETGPSPITSTEGASTEEHLADIWKNQVCIDCNKFGNIARFIRHRNKDRKTKKTNSGPGSSQSQSQALLIQRLVYNNAGDRRYPKLALFAAVKILANTELLI